MLKNLNLEPLHNKKSTMINFQIPYFDEGKVFMNTQLIFWHEKKFCQLFITNSQNGGDEIEGFYTGTKSRFEEGNVHISYLSFGKNQSVKGVIPRSSEEWNRRFIQCIMGIWNECECCLVGSCFSGLADAEVIVQKYLHSKADKIRKVVQSV